MSEIDKIMVRIYADLVENGKRTLESIPEKLKNYVVEELEKRGYSSLITLGGEKLRMVVKNDDN